MLVQINKTKCLIFITGALVALISVLSYDSFSITYILAAICVSILVGNAVLGRWDDYLVFYLIFFGLSLEYAFFVGDDNFYSIKNIRIAGLNLGIWMLLPIWFGAFFYRFNLNKVRNKYRFFWKSSIGLIYINIIAAAMGLLMLIFNDNGVLYTKGWLSSYIEVFYMHALIPFSVFLCLILILRNENTISKIVFKGTVALEACMWGVVIQLLISRIFGIYGDYDGLATLMTSAISNFLPFMLMISFYKKNTYFRKTNFLMALIGLLLLMLFNANGKLFVLLFLVLIILYLYFINQKQAIMKVLPTIFVIVGALFAVFFLGFLASKGHILLGSKLSQTLSMVQFWRPNWLQNMDMSPRFRLAEFANLFIEFAKKPWLIISGKGFGGTIKDHTGFFSLVPVYMRLTGFSAKQWENGLFYNLHEIVNSLLIFGLMWVVYFIKTVKRVLKTYKTYLWFIIGAYWILVYYGYSFTLTTFGAIAYFIGALEVDEDVVVSF